MQINPKNPAMLSLQGAYAEYKMVHMAVAKKFMKNAPSLLKTQAQSDPNFGDLTKEKQFVYDAFFLVRRIEDPTIPLEETFAEKLLQVKLDLQANLFFPGRKVPNLFQGQKKISALLHDPEKIIHLARTAFAQSFEHI